MAILDFDHILYKCECPRCGEPVVGFQSKDGPCDLRHLQPAQVNNFYSSCECCCLWIEFTRVIRPIENFTMEWRDKSRCEHCEDGSKIVEIFIHEVS